MEKIGKTFLLFFVFLAVLLFPLSTANNCTNFTYSEWGSCTNGVQTRTIISRIPENCTGGNPILNRTCTEENRSKTKVDLAYECLERELREDCSGANTVQQIALSILATPKIDILKKCVEKLESKEKQEGCFGDDSCNIKDTALAILALEHVKKNTTKYENWLLSKNISSSQVEWILQQESEGETSCTLKYENNDYQFTARENKKLSGNFGPCFSPTYQNYWLRINNDCLNKNMKIGCNKKFLISFIYRSPGSEKINVLSNTKEGAQNSEIEFSVNSKCFGIGNCNYEETAWAVVVLGRKGYDIKPYIPYLISSEEDNKQYFPEVFSYMVLGNERLYGEKIMKMQSIGKYWEAENSAYGKYYDTSLVLLALGHINQQQINEAKNWTWFSQESNGCWNSKNIRDSAFLLWATQQRKASLQNLSLPNVITTTRCDQGPSGSSCTKQADCLNAGGSILRNYDCSYSNVQLGVCCNITIRTKTCSEEGGKFCLTNQICSSITKNTSDGICCLGNCSVENRATSSLNQSKDLVEEGCKKAGGTCRASCKSDEEEGLEECPESTKVCCKKKSGEEGDSLLWLWIVLGVLIILVIIIILMKDKIKVMLYKNSTKEKGPVGPNFSGGPTKPGFPPISGEAIKPPIPIKGPMPIQRPIGQPINRPIQRPIPQKRPQVFDKLKEISK